MQENKVRRGRGRPRGSKKEPRKLITVALPGHLFEPVKAALALRGLGWKRVFELGLDYHVLGWRALAIDDPKQTKLL